MGLDVSAYGRLVKLDVVFDENGEPIDPVTRESIDQYVRVWENPDFPGRSAGLESKGIYSFGCFMEGWSGGYGRYNVWRENLAKLAGYQPTPYKSYGETRLRHDAGAWECQEGPFWELILFSDCDGTIGPVVSAKLAADFAAYDEQAKSMDEDFYERYCQWRHCFEMAADGGCVRFH